MNSNEPNAFAYLGEFGTINKRLEALNTKTSD